MYRSTAILCALSATSLASADLITFTYTGPISVTFDNVPAVRGQTITFSYDFDSEAVASVHPSGVGTMYVYPLLSAQGSIGSTIYTDFSGGSIAIIDNGPQLDGSFLDQYLVTANFPTDQFNELQFGVGFYSECSSPCPALTSTALPLTPPDRLFSNGHAWSRLYATDPGVARFCKY